MNTIKMLKHGIAPALLLLSFTTYAQDKVIPYSEVPAQIRTYIKTHFPGSPVIQSEIDREGMSKKYEINLEGIKLEFNSKYRIIDIDGKSRLPDSVIPQKIRQYVTTNYSGNVITDWEIDGRKQQIGLDNGVDLEFTMSGDFIRIDN
jgi:hypothetical protein